MSKELVYHPDHYNKEGRKECWDEMIDVSPEGTLYFDIWNAYKYAYRKGTKEGNPEIQDLEKIQNYINHAYTILDNFEISKKCVADIKLMIKRINELYVSE